MPRQIAQLANGEIYHICLRAVGDAEVFLNENDYYRGIFSIYEFNNKKSVRIWKRRRDRIVEKKKEKFGRSPTPPEFKRDLLVEVLAFAFMPNHIHLLVKQLKDNGVSQFMQKVGGGYANYFNKKNKRKGHLFNQFRAIHVSTDKQLRNVFVYIHANPISLIEPGWKKNGIKDPKKVIKFLKNYRWSSYKDYIGEKNFSSVTSRDFLLEAIGDVGKCEQTIKDWVSCKKLGDFDDMANIALE